MQFSKARLAIVLSDIVSDPLIRAISLSWLGSQMQVTSDIDGWMLSECSPGNLQSISSLLLFPSPLSSLSLSSSFSFFSSPSSSSSPLPSLLHPLSLCLLYIDWIPSLISMDNSLGRDSLHTDDKRHLLIGRLKSKSYRRRSRHFK